MIRPCCRYVYACRLRVAITPLMIVDADYAATPFFDDAATLIMMPTIDADATCLHAMPPRRCR